MMHQAIRQTYVGAMRKGRDVARKTGVLEKLEARPTRRNLWLRSLFAIYDFDDLSRLDLPWWTFDAVREGDSFLRARPDARVFEWGSGASTLWLSKRAGQVTSVEHDGEWHQMVQGRLEGVENVTLRHVAMQDAGRVGSRKAGFAGQHFDRYVHRSGGWTGWRFVCPCRTARPC